MQPTSGDDAVLGDDGGEEAGSGNFTLGEDDDEEEDLLSVNTRSGSTSHPESSANYNQFFVWKRNFCS